MAKLTARGRKSLPAEDFAGKDRSYPVPDRNHARLALAMVSKYGSSEEKSRVRSKVKSKFPSIGKKSRSWNGA